MGQLTNIFLIGPMGAGKSTIGRRLAELLALDFEDTDHEIQRRTGVDIPTIFEFEGEQGFRHREKVVLEELSGRSGQVVATGGGIVLDRENCRLLSERGVVVYLYCTPHQQYERTAHDSKRPLLQTKDPLSRLTELMRQRDPIYRELADFVVSTQKRSATAVVHEVARKIEQHGLDFLPSV